MKEDKIMVGIVAASPAASDFDPLLDKCLPGNPQVLSTHGLGLSQNFNAI
jgi:hypothetical protein